MITLAAPRAWLWLAPPAALALALYAPLVPDLAREWSEFPSLSHGFAIPLIAAYLAWIRRDRLARTPVRPSLLGLPLLVAGLAALVIGVLGQEPFVARLSLPLTLGGLVWFVAGGAVARLLWVPIAYLFFMVPLPWSTLKLVMYQSRLLDAAVSAELVRWLGVPVFRDGFMLHLPALTLEVADDCSSIPAIAALLSLGVAYAYFSPRPAAYRGLLIAATLPIAIFSNIVRITTTVAAAYYLGPWTLHTVYHQFNGTVNFLLTFLFLMAFDTALLRALGRVRCAG
ncbi:MAG TPA: exosortase/archaeosortase family protein [Candidatus Binatia bacterium]|nr:exosortase/archaeosortase family protein [Candidatus Binatia bacterium]